MDSKKRRSSLRRYLATDMVSTDIKTQIKRRISFSGKNSVREFHGEEEPKTWNNSYEISDHLNVNETASNLCAPPKPKTLRSVLKNSNENKENVEHEYIKQVEGQIDTNQKKCKNESISNNVSVLSSTKDMINVSYQHQNSKMYQIENSVDITLYEKELKFQVAKDKAGDQTRSLLYSFSLEDNEKETRSVMFGEKTNDFMCVLQDDTTQVREDNINVCNFKDKIDVTVFSEYMEEDQYIDFTNTKDKITKEPVTIYMNDSVSISDNENEKSNNKRKTLQGAAMQLSPNKTNIYNKENINPTSMQNANETQNYSCQMEINDEVFSEAQPMDVNVEKESVAFQDKLNQLSLLQESDDNMQIDKSLHLGNVESNVKPRQTINFNECIEMSPKDKNVNTPLVKNKISSRPTINFNQPIEISPGNIHKTSHINEPIQNMSFRPAITFSETMEISPKKINNKSRPTINFNQSIEVESQNDVVDNRAQHGAIPKVKSRSTINCNQPIESSPIKQKINVPRETLYLKENICVSPKLSQEPLLGISNNLNVPGSTRKHGQHPKLIVRKICTPLVNKNKNPVDLEQQRMLRYKKKHQEIVEPDKPKDVAMSVTDAQKPPKVDKSLNFSLSSVKNMSLSPESSSPLIPPEFKAYNLKQLNDEIERGKINVFSNAPKTPNTGRKNRFAASNFPLNSAQLSQTTTKQRRTLVFDDVDIPIASDDTLKTAESNNVFDFNTTQEVAQYGKNNAKCRYSQADDIMLDNTSFLTRAKLSDETLSRNSSKRELTQLNDIMHVFNESLREAASKLDRGITDSSVKSKKSYNKENDTLSSMFLNAKPIFTQTITNIKDMNLYPTMDISHEIINSEDDKRRKDFDDNNFHQDKTVLLNHDIECSINASNSNNINNNFKEIPDEGNSCIKNEMEIDDRNEPHVEKQKILVEKSTRQTIYFNNDNEEQYLLKDDKPVKENLYIDEDVDDNNIQLEIYNQDETQHKPIRNFERNCGRQTMYLNNDIEDSFKADSPKNDNTMKTTNDNINCIKSIETTIQSRKRETLYPNEDIAAEIESDVIHNKEKESTEPHETQKCKIPSRYTTHFEDDNIIDEHFVNIEQSENIENSKNPQTLIYNQDINQDNSIAIPEKESIRIKETDNVNTLIKNSNPIRKTLFYSEEICELNETKAQNIDDKLCEKISRCRKSVYITQDMDVTLNEVISGVKDNEQLMGLSPGSIDNRQYVEKQDNANITKLPSDKKSIHGIKSRNSIYVTQDMDVTLNKVISTINDNDQLMDLDPSLINSKKNIEADNTNATKIPTGRKSIYTAEGMDLSLDVCVEEVKKKEIDCESQGKKIALNMDDSKDNGNENGEEIAKEIKELSLSENIKANKENQKTLIFNDNNEMSFDQSFTPAENFKFPEHTEPLNVAKTTLARHISTNVLPSKSKITNNDLITPVKLTGINSNYRLFHVTPRLSLLEFTAVEKRVGEEERLQRAKYLSPLRSENTNKRLPVNITPVLSIPKKRQTLIFDDCLMDESKTSLSAENSMEKATSSNEKVNDIEESKKQEPFYISKRSMGGHTMDISGIVANDSVLQTPTKQRKSRIPIPISSGKKSKRSNSLLQTSIDHYKDEGDQLATEGDNLTESIQLMRRATTFIQRRDTEIENNDLEIENEPVKKTSIFEGNPITISDVSVFFEAQRNSNSVVPETEMSLHLDKMSKSGLEAIEKAKKSLENRYLNLTLEDIDKTRLSLVRISYEDGGVNNSDVSVHEQNNNGVENRSPQNDEVISDDGVENNWKNRRQSVNYLRNVSAVCRKCKRCQDTLLNETTSSTSESFVLPPLPPIPDLGLDRLRRLRKRPTIADVNILWQRVSLDRTIINALNISDDDSQIISDLDDEVDDESSPVTKCIRKYEKDMMSFELDLLEKHQNKTSSEELLPFVLRLDALLSTNLTNWIFDFQMQYRGILLFTHKQMYTFSVMIKFDEVDPLGHEISLKSVKLEKGLVPEKNWKAIDFVLDFQFKLNLPFHLQSLCEGSNEAGIFKMLQIIDRVCLDTIKMGKQLQRISFTNQASIIRDQFRTYVRKVIRKVVNANNSDFKYVEKTEIKVELLNLKKLSFRDIVSPPLHNFREEIHLLPTGLQFLQEFLPNPFNYIKHY